LLVVFVWFMMIPLAVISIIRGVVEGNATYILWGTPLAAVSALLMKVSEKEWKKVEEWLEELCREGGSK